MMTSQAVRLPGKLIAQAKQYGKISKRSVPMQLEYWAEIGKIAEENPTTPYLDLGEILKKQAEESEYMSQEELLEWQKTAVQKAKESLNREKSIPSEKFMSWAKSLATDTPENRPSLAL